jgi:hypothetical protein
MVGVALSKVTANMILRRRAARRAEKTSQDAAT